MFLKILFAVIKGMLELDGIQLDRKPPSGSEPLVASEKPCLSATTTKPCQPN